MSNILVVLGSARPNRVADKVAGYVVKDIEARGDTAIIADLKELALPFFDNENAPASPNYVITNPQVLVWQKMVQDADSVIFMTPEYNHSLTGIQKNAIDQFVVEWNDKPVSAVGYGWSGASLALATFREVMTHLKSDLKPNEAHLFFMKDINPDGSIIDEANVAKEISEAVAQIA